MWMQRLVQVWYKAWDAEDRWLTSLAADNPAHVDLQHNPLTDSLSKTSRPVPLLASRDGVKLINMKADSRGDSDG